MMAPMALPLEDVRIISVEQYGAGPYSTLHLADLGAEIIKIENPESNGDIGRYVPPYQAGEDSLFFESFNRNKLSLSLDITSPAGRQVFEDLVKTSDAVFSNLRGDVPARLRLRYEDLRDLNPAIVCCSLSAFGLTGPRSSEPGYDYVFQALAGWMTLTGEPDGPPAKSGLSLVDYSAGLVGTISLLAGIHTARATGVGMDCDVSLYDTAIAMLTYVGTWHATMDYQPVRTARSAHPSLVPFQIFPASDGWVVIGCAKEKFWRRLVKAIDEPELDADPRFGDFESRFENREVLLTLLEEKFMSATSEHWLGILREAGVPCAPVNTVEQALKDEHTMARDLVVETEHPRWGTVKSMASPVRVGPPRQEHVRAPFRNESAGYVLGSVLGYNTDRISQLAEQGAFGDRNQEIG